MKLIKIVQMLAKKGMPISYRFRNDGGVVVTSLAGVRYKGSAGNIEARKVAGAKLSDKQIAQRIKAYQASPLQFDMEFRKQLKATQKAMKANPDFHHGKMSSKLAKSKIEYDGRDKTLQVMKNLETMAKGLAYETVVETLILRLARLDWEKFSESIGVLHANIREIPDKLIPQMYDIGYDVGKGATSAEEGNRLIMELLDSNL